MSQGRTGSRRSISFSKAGQGRGVDTEDLVEALGTPGDSKFAPSKQRQDPFVTWQGLKSDARLIGDKLKRLGVDATGVHGDLQVILSAARRIEAHVKDLIEDTEQ